MKRSVIASALCRLASIMILLFVFPATGDESSTPSSPSLTLTVTDSFPEVVSGQQGIATDGTHIYVQSTSVLAKYDRKGRLVKKTNTLQWHHGGITCHNGVIYAAVSECCKEGTDKHWINVYDAETLEKTASYDVAAHFTVCAGGIAYFDDHFYVAESYYDNDHADYIVKFDKDFQFVATYTVPFKSPYGIQGLAYLPEQDKFMVNSHGKRFYLIDTNFNPTSLEVGKAPFELQDLARINETTLVLNNRPGKRIVFATLPKAKE